MSYWPFSVGILLENTHKIIVEYDQISMDLLTISQKISQYLEQRQLTLLQLCFSDAMETGGN